MEAAANSGDERAIIPLLPRAFEFAFAQIEEIKRDMANAHVRLIAPYLARHGAEYERAKFEVRVAVYFVIDLFIFFRCPSSVEFIR